MNDFPKTLFVRIYKGPDEKAYIASESLGEMKTNELIGVYELVDAKRVIKTFSDNDEPRPGVLGLGFKTNSAKISYRNEYIDNDSHQS
uniref:Uncharacterized protein n=1 Tax=viral metagenome TaxID=1070528 RepID=A0A6M3JEE1_9ZZZZ